MSKIFFKNVSNKNLTAPENLIEDVSENKVENNLEPENIDLGEVEGTEENKEFKVKFKGKKYKVIAENEEDAINKIRKFFGEELPVEQKEKITITVKDIFNAILDEINRIVTVAHPETATNSYDRWVAVLTEELGEVVHEINDEYEGKEPNKNMFVECVQLASATILLAKKYAAEHPEMFESED